MWVYNHSTEADGCNEYKLQLIWSEIKMDDFEKNILTESKKAFENLKIEIKATGIENPKFFDDFDSEEFEIHSREYIDYYKEEISEFAIEIYHLNEDPKARIKYARILFSLLHVGFSTYLQAREDKEKVKKK